MRLVSVLAFVGLVSGCSNGGDEGMFVLNNSAPPAGTVCTFTGDKAQLFTSAGTISFDAGAAGTGYILAPLIESRITTTSDAQIAQRTIRLEGANITATVQPSGVKQQYSVLFSGSVAPGGTTNVSFEALPAASITALGKADVNTQVVLSVQIYGMLGGSRIDAETFTYPVTIVAQGKGIVFDAGPCATDVAVARTGNACNPYQDGVVDCCTSKSGDQVCPAVPGI
ncbi:hypothetical protein BH11MYX1_BH11MYX1_03960 [soil metagenome]